jgi:hypothetical protein
MQRCRDRHDRLSAIAGLTTLNPSAQSLLPPWVRARGLAVYLLVF